LVLRCFLWLVFKFIASWDSQLDLRFGASGQVREPAGETFRLFLDAPDVLAGYIAAVSWLCGCRGPAGRSQGVAETTLSASRLNW